MAVPLLDKKIIKKRVKKFKRHESDRYVSLKVLSSSTLSMFSLSCNALPRSSPMLEYEILHNYYRLVVVKNVNLFFLHDEDVKLIVEIIITENINVKLTHLDNYSPVCMRNVMKLLYFPRISCHLMMICSLENYKYKLFCISKCLFVWKHFSFCNTSRVSILYEFHFINLLISRNAYIWLNCWIIFLIFGFVIVF